MQLPDIQQQLIHGDRNRALWVASVISDVFGVSSPVYLPWGKDAKWIPEYGSVEKLPDYTATSPSPEGDIGEGGLSELGTPVFGVIRFGGGVYNRYSRRTGNIEQAKYGGYTLPWSCLVDFSRESNVVTTEMLGGNGTVKELYGLGDWNISIRGIAVNGGNKYGDNAHAQIKHLIDWADICDAIEVEGAVFSGKGIYRMVIKKIDIQPLQARYNVIPFQIEAVSDEALELVL
jgi:hypothetical protein